MQLFKHKQLIFIQTVPDALKAAQTQTQLSGSKWHNLKQGKKSPYFPCHPSIQEPAEHP